MATAEIRAKATLDKTGFDASLSGMQAGVARFKGAIAGAFSVGAVVGFARSVVNMGDQIRDAADQAGVGVETFQSLGIAFQRAGSNAERAVGVIAKLRDAQTTLSEGGAAADKLADKLRVVGVNVDAFRVGGIEEMINALASAKDETGFFAAAVELVGVRQAPVFMAALKEMGGSVEGFASTLKQNGEIMDAYTASSLARAADAYDSIARRLKIFAANVVNAFSDIAAAVGAFNGSLLAGVGGVFESLVKGELPSIKDLNPIAQLEEAFADMHAAIKRNAEERQKYLDQELEKTKEIVEARNDADAPGNQDPLLVKLETEKAQGRIALSKELTDAEAASMRDADASANKIFGAQQQAPSLDVNDMRRVGGALLGVNSPVQFQQRQLKTLEQIREELERTRKETIDAMRERRLSESAGVFT